jgi:NAD(P)H-hydrate epimerase
MIKNGVDGPVPWITTAQMIEVDRAMIEDFGIGLIQMMENAGRSLAHLARERFLGGDPRGKKVVVMAGTGGNGGGALVCARRLAGWGADVHVVVSRPDEAFTPVPRSQLAILRTMGVPIAIAGSEDPSLPADVIIDGLIGYNLQGAPRGTVADLIRQANTHPAPVLSMDVPSGIDSDSGSVFDPAIRAAATMSLALPKIGLRAPDAEGHVDELYLADIGVPPSLYATPSIGLSVGPLFATADLVQL